MGWWPKRESNDNLFPADFERASLDRLSDRLENNARARGNRPAAKLQPIAKSSSRPTPDSATFAASKGNSTSNQAAASELSLRSAAGVDAELGQLKLDGNVLLCQCIACRGPMSIRLWLMLGECWQCGTQLELSPRQQAVVEAFVESRTAPLAEPPTAVPRGAGLTSPSAITPNPAQPVRKPITTAVAEKSVPKPAPKPAPKPVTRSLPKLAMAPVQAPPVEMVAAKKKSRARSIVDWLESAPAWLLSLILHLLLLLLLAMIDLAPKPDQTIILSLAIDRARQIGDVPAILVDDERQFDVPVPDWLDPEDPVDREVVAESQELAADLNRWETDGQLTVPSIEAMRRQIRQPYRTESALVARDVRLRQEMLQQNGGTLMTEAAVARGLKWLADRQNEDGSWSLDDRRMDPGRGTLHSDEGATALALLPFLGAGQTPNVGIYRDVVRRGVDRMLAWQKETGDLRGKTRGDAGMYVHGQSAIVLCETYALTGDKKYFEPASRSLDFIAEAQHSRGGWRYEPGQAGDTSVLGWQLMALQSGKMSGIEPDPAVLKGASKFLDSVQSARGSVYSYQIGRKPTANMTAEGLLCRMYLGWDRNKREMQLGLVTLLEESPPDPRAIDYYYWYYATQAFHHAGGPMWEQWNGDLREILVQLQRTSGKQAGSWDPDGLLSEQGGRLYVTALAICTLEVYYRHLPLFAPL